MLEFMLSLPPKKPGTVFLGEVAGADFITAAALTTLVGMGSTGTVTNASVNWLKYTYLGKTVYLAKKVLRHGMTWEALNALGLVFGNQQFMINGKAHTVRLPTGYIPPVTSQYTISTGGSFNDLVYPIYNGVSKDHPYVMAYPRLAAYLDVDLGLETTYTAVSNGNGTMSWVQDSYTPATHHMVRCYNDQDKAHQLTAGWYVPNNTTANYAGWRPIIEEV
jgi:hypothetical protein